ncbi:MAG: GH13_10 / GH13 / GH13_9 / GH13_36 / GH13_ 11 / GH13_37 / GH13_20 [uncultured Propionibacteriaceae bacterium]|uniref:Malto-oligosyltrehalose trehalohydrolase n=1 Tax=uncultured Propionibacteriaceae bacterium TaxID=257457 RepID=A0A6J4N297_9ACTN|nr:MAG: GH13_10 / GH13 / GH13_9 / GH13_36 / GH13_ 11 / GH13_37 / GH13_20 [uncultured Propionibacteriaceae bacterium]
MNRKEQLSVWAPKAQHVTLVIADRRFPMRRDDGDWWRPGEELTDDLVDSDVDYGFLVDDSDKPLPDPRSRRQPNGLHELSRTYEPTSYAWGDQAWTGRQLAGGVIYEMHVGTFTPEGTLLSAIDRLDHLVGLGIDFVEVMPVNGFNGTHNWGYDGVLWYTVQEQYGGPAAYQQFVDACHQRGLAVIQDVVYNHLGPSGNYLALFGPYLKEGRGNTWGDSVNLDTENSDEVRRYIIENALMWLRDYHVDGLRLDAVHALVDTRATHLLEQMAIEVDALSAFARRPLSLVAESDMNAPRLITPREAGGYGLAGQWSDDFHHALYVSLTGDTTGYYADFGSLETLAKVFRAGFFHDGTMSTFRGRHHGARIDTQRMPTWRLVVFSDNHDQIGNRAAGNRLSSWLNADQLRLAGLVTLLSPFTPMIFMGEEWGASTPWQFFTSHPEPELGEIVAKGRVEEFAQMDWDISTVPNPQDPSTFTNSKLNWDEISGGSHAKLLEFYRRVIEVRRTYPDLTDPRFDRSAASCSDEDGWLMVQRGEIVMVVNFSEFATEVPLTGPVSTVLEVGSAAISGDTAKLGAHSAVVASIL